jgi:hypothetical protein
MIKNQDQAKVNEDQKKSINLMKAAESKMQFQLNEKSEDLEEA